jgi:hypothetical protein
MLLPPVIAAPAAHELLALYAATVTMVSPPSSGPSVNHLDKRWATTGER